METIKKRVSDLELASLPLKGNEFFELSQGGVSKRILAGNFFADGWFAKLQASPDEFVAPDAIRADQADAAMYADDSGAVNGVSLVEGPGDAVEEVTLKPGDTFMVPKGSFEFYAVASDSTALADFSCLADDPRAHGFWMLKANFFSGLILSDGHSKKIVNTGTKNHILVIRVVAHKA